METAREEPPTTKITGTVMQVGALYRAAFHTRDGTCWVAEFHGERGELIDAATWVRTVPAWLGSHGRRAAALATATELTPELCERIEALHRQAEEDRRAARVSQAWIRARRWCAELAASVHRTRAPRLDRP